VIPSLRPERFVFVIADLLAAYMLSFNQEQLLIGPHAIHFVSGYSTNDIDEVLRHAHIRDPKRFSRCNLGVNKPGTDGDKPSFY
jgi:hypothetical protein